MRIARIMQLAECIGHRRHPLLFQQVRIHPLGKLWQPCKRAFDRPAQHLGHQPGSHWIDRLDQRHFAGFRHLHHQVGMHHGGPAIEPIHLAAHHHLFIHGQRLVQPVAFDAKEGQRQFACLVMQEHTVRLVGFSRRRRLVAIDPALDRDDGALWRERNARAVAPVNDRGGGMEEHIDHPAILSVFAIRHARDQIGQFRADAGQTSNGCKQGIKQGRTHGRQNALEFACLARLTMPSFRPISATQRRFEAHDWTDALKRRS